MAIKNRTRTANDNTPAIHSGFVHSHGLDYTASTPKRPSPQPTQPTSDLINSGKPNLNKESPRSLTLTIGCWAAATIMMLITFALDFGTAPKIFASITLFWLGLWNSYVSADYGLWRLSEISVVTALAGLLGVTITSVNYFGANLTLADGLLLMSVLPILAGYILKSRICILASICACLIWTALSFSGLVETSRIMMLMPIIFSAQLFLATKIRSGMAISLAVITAYYWIFSFILAGWSTDNLPLTFAAAAIFILGTAHHRSGKALEDKRQTGSSIHIHTGWLAAMVGAIGFQYFWLTPEAIQNSTATLGVTELNLWKAVVVIALGIIFCSAIIRYKHSRISLAGIFLVTATSAIIPAMLWLPAWPQNITTAIPGISVMPTIGILIGAAISATALGMAFNGIRRHSSLMMAMGIIVIFAEACLLMKPEFFTLDNSIVFITGFLSALAVGATIAGTSLAHQAPAPRLKHA